MRTGYGVALILGGVIAACTGEVVTDAAGGRAGGGHAMAGVAGVVTAGFSGTSGAGNGGAGNAGGAAGTAGSITTGGHSGTAGAAGHSGTAGSAGAAGTTQGEGGTAGEGAAGEGGVAGASDTTAGEAGAGNEGGSAGAGEGGAPSEGGSAGEAGEVNDAGAAGQNASGAAGAGGVENEPVGLSWPIDCIPNETCTGIGYPDTNSDGDAHDCGEPGYFGHQGTDIGITFEAQNAGTAVRAAADGVVLFAFDGKYDRCPDSNEADCQEPSGTLAPGSSNGTTVCTPEGPYCGTGEGNCYWCFAGGNVIVIRHEGVPGVFATRYDHLKRNSLLVEPGDSVTRGQKIAEAASAGASTAPHLHFEVWGTGFYELADPWAGTCGPNTGPSLWAFDPPWSG
jgi:murein DD-endopeptidase MepM/ murein hydrolase activator NlpD